MTSPEPRYVALGEALRFPAGAAEVVAVEPVSGRVHVLSIEQARVLAALRRRPGRGDGLPDGGERTVEEHAAHAASSLGMGAEPARALVLGLAMKGFLAERDELSARLRAAARADGSRAVIGTLGVPARGRTASVVACVQSHLEAARAHGREVTVVVADSAEGAPAEATRAALSPLCAQGVIRIAGREERARFAKVLAASAEVDPAVVLRTLLGDARIGPDTGANRCALLLDCAGEPLVMADDDVRARFTRGPFGGPAGGADPLLGARPALLSGEPFAAFFPDPGEDAVADGQWVSLDPFALHEALLGADVAEIAAAAPGELWGAGADLARRLARRGGRVVITQLGCAGDHGLGGGSSLLFVRGATRERLLASDERMRDALARRRLVRCAERAAICDTDHVMSMHIGVDNRELVPPFVLAGRNSDGVLGALLQRCAEDAFVGFVPWAIAHRAAGSGEEARSASIEQEIASAGRTSLNDVLRVVLAALVEPRGAGTAAHLEAAGSALVRLASRPREAHGFFREQVVRGLGRVALRAEQLLDEHGRRPEAWASLVSRLRDGVLAALCDPDVHLPSELVDAHGTLAARALLLEHASNVGLQLAAWPAMTSAARRLRARGERISARIQASSG